MATTVLCIPGDFPDPSGLQKLLAPGFELDFENKPDPRMPNAFSASRCRASDSIGDDDLLLLRQHRHVAYVIHEAWSPENAARLAHQLLRIGSDVLDAGGMGIKVENAGIAHSPASWGELTRRADGAMGKLASADPEQKLAIRERFWGALFEAYVQRPILSEDALYSCGMHVLGERDLLISLDRATAAFGRVQTELDVAMFFHTFAVYLLAESEVRDGHTFRTGPVDPRFRLALVPCTAYASDNLFWNPSGYIRFDGA